MNVRGTPYLGGMNKTSSAGVLVVFVKLDNEGELLETAITTAKLIHTDERSAQASTLWCLEEARERTMPEHAKYWKEQLSGATDLDKTMPKIQKNRKRNGSQVNMEPRGEAL